MEPRKSSQYKVMNIILFWGFSVSEILLIPSMICSFTNLKFLLCVINILVIIKYGHEMKNVNNYYFTIKTKERN